MKKFGSITVCNSSDPIDVPALFGESVVVRLSLIPHPEVTWKYDARTEKYGLEKIATLKSLGLFSDEAHASTDGSVKAIDVITEFPDLPSAMDACMSAVKSGIVDIYVYDRGVIHFKYD